MHTLLAERRLPHHTLRTWEWTSSALGCSKRADVLVPHHRTGPLAALYLLHGFGGSRSTWLTGTRLAEHLAGRDLLVVLPESGRRWFVNDDRGVRYEDYLVHELVPFVDDRYADTLRPGVRGIGGFSMGGAAALMQALRHPDVFSTALSHAGAFEAPLRTGDPYAELRTARDTAIPSTEAHERVWGPSGSPVRARYELTALLAGHRPADPPLSVYADVGTGDYPRILGMNRRTARRLTEAGLDTDYRERPGGHDLAFLDQALPHSLEFAENRLGRSRPCVE
ncbi:alpha/beta fold hydrolase [Streptomyces sp. NPDC097619]|uniref:alpha/beta hydrolase n=1 Tax=Streptomyces sp. NPDC097619 TaxID=3157228 RepID=UPI00332B34B0